MAAAGPDDELEMEIVQSWLDPATHDDFLQQHKSRAKPLFHAQHEHGPDGHHHHGTLWVLQVTGRSLLITLPILHGMSECAGKHHHSLD